MALVSFVRCPELSMDLGVDFTITNIALAWWLSFREIGTKLQRAKSHRDTYLAELGSPVVENLLSRVLMENLRMWDILTID